MVSNAFVSIDLLPWCCCCWWQQLCEGISPNSPLHRVQSSSLSSAPDQKTTLLLAACQGSYSTTLTHAAINKLSFCASPPLQNLKILITWNVLISWKLEGSFQQLGLVSECKLSWRNSRHWWHASIKAFCAVTFLFLEEVVSYIISQNDCDGNIKRVSDHPWWDAMWATPLAPVCFFTHFNTLLLSGLSL